MRLLNSDRITDFSVTSCFEVSNNVANFASTGLCIWYHARTQMPYFKRKAMRLCGEHLNRITSLNCAINNAHVENNATVVIVVTVKNKRAGRRITLAPWAGNPFNHSTKHLVDILTSFCTNLNDVIFTTPKEVYHFFAHPRYVGCW